MKCKVFCEKSEAALQKSDWLPPLLIRLSVGWVMLESGWGKFHALDKVTEFFASLGIPAASLQAPFVAGVELIGGICLILGIFTRLVSIPLLITMVVAILTAKRDDIGSFSDLFGFSEYLYILLLLWLIYRGAGTFSLDHILKKKCQTLN